ncbi:MAG TPA: isoprenylcysteine carboxylmethyltransferase family protein [Edaphobacter sp.]|jgi:protein-S-isoprenylcysteine O-methyltransferase Ste14|nr:isoprenylcysteine carboxylmethyltransferase family protein [Edaphobacter sp.]
MKATPLEFRFRFLILAVIYLLGFVAPWDQWLHLNSIRTWQLIASWPTRAGWLSFNTATIVVLLIGILFAFVGAALRTWGTAYLSPAVVQDSAMHGEGVVAAGPYRHLRNPLYLGTLLHTFALALLMPPSGAIFCILAVFLFQLRLIASEESFLTAKLGEPYLTYCAKVSRLVPAITPRVPASTLQPKWPTAFLGEIYMWGVVATFAILGWRYNSILLIKGILVSLGISLIVRAFLPRR